MRACSVTNAAPASCGKRRGEEGKCKPFAAAHTLGSSAAVGSKRLEQAKGSRLIGPASCQLRCRATGRACARGVPPAVHASPGKRATRTGAPAPHLGGQQAHTACGPMNPRQPPTSETPLNARRTCAASWLCPLVWPMNTHQRHTSLLLCVHPTHRTPHTPHLCGQQVLLHAARVVKAGAHLDRHHAPPRRLAAPHGVHHGLGARVQQLGRPQEAAERGGVAGRAATQACAQASEEGSREGDRHGRICAYAAAVLSTRPQRATPPCTPQRGAPQQIHRAHGHRATIQARLRLSWTCAPFPTSLWTRSRDSLLLLTWTRRRCP